MQKILTAFTISCFAILLISTSLSSCYYDSEEALGLLDLNCDTIAVSYADDIVPILQGDCYSCHSSANASGSGGENNLEGYTNISGYVVIGDPDNSLLYGTTAWLPGYLEMPRPTGSAQLSDCQQLLIKSWILQGALDN